MTYNVTGKRIRSENLAGQVTTTAWDCCHKVSETQPDGSTTTWDYDDEGRMIASSRLIPLDMTNVTWLTTCYEHDDLGRQTATWQTNFAAQVGLPATRTRYDQLSRVIARVDQLGNTTMTTYSSDSRTVSLQNPNTSTRVITRSVSGDTLSITGSAITPEFHTYGILPDGTRWSRVVQGETASSPRFTKRYENLIDQTIREERSGFQGAVLATVHNYDAYGRLVCTSADYEPTVEYTYDLLGNRVATTRVVGRAVSMNPPEWRKTETLSSFILDGSTVWLTQTNIVSCSDSAIAPLVTSSARQLTGLTASLPARSRSADVRGNVTENETLVDTSFVASCQPVPYATNKPLSVSRYGVSLMDVSVSAVTNTVAYDPLGRQIAQTDGRGNKTLTEYNSFGQRSAYIDALGNRTSYVYDRFGHLVSATNPLGITTVYEYDLRGHKLFEGGASYPVRYAYDVFGRKISMRTFRDQANAVDDETVWNYDEAIDVVTNKVYADGKRVEYCYDAIGRNTQRIWARGVTTTYSYDNWGNLIQREYSDGTPAVRITYDAVGRLKHVADESGISDFEYNDFGDQTAKVMDGISGHNEIAYFFDSYGRDIGYTINGVRISELEYDPTTTRLIAMKTVGCDTNFVWSYLSGSDLKESLMAPNGVSTTWRYDNRDQMTEVSNATPTNVISRYAYSYNAIGLRSICEMSGTAFDSSRANQYFYNSRCELTNVVAFGEQTDSYSYKFDDIGNRLMAIERGELTRFGIGELNQATNIVAGANEAEVFNPVYDADGNQILVKTETGVWHVTYNGENRPVKWERNDRTINVTYDFLGRMVARDGIGFMYDGFKLIYDTRENHYVWDPSEIRSFRPLALFDGTKLAYYFLDGNKNVSDIVALNGDVVSHYEYSPFGQTIKATATNGFVNPFRFSSEYYDEELGVISYLARNYNCRTGRWLQRDHGGEDFGLNLYAFVHNDPVSNVDYLGFKGFNCRKARSQFYKDFGKEDKGSSLFSRLRQLKKIGFPEFSIGVNVYVENEVCNECCGGGRVGYSIDRTTSFSIVGAISFKVTPWGPFSPWSIPVGVSYSLGGGSHYTYNSCTGEETSQKCNTFSLTGSGGVAVGLGKAISYKGTFSVSYSWSNCGGESSGFNIALDVEQCYWGICWAANLFTFPDGPKTK